MLVIDIFLPEIYRRWRVGRLFGLRDSGFEGPIISWRFSKTLSGAQPRRPFEQRGGWRAEAERAALRAEREQVDARRLHRQRVLPALPQMSPLSARQNYMSFLLWCVNLKPLVNTHLLKILQLLRVLITFTLRKTFRPIVVFNNSCTNLNLLNGTFLRFLWGLILLTFQGFQCKYVETIHSTTQKVFGNCCQGCR